MAERRRWLRWVIACAAAIAVLAVAGPYVYIHFVAGKAPAPLGLRASPSGTASGSGTTSSGSGGSASGITGTWRAGSGSVLGYRVKEILLGQDNVAVGRSHAVSGHLVIAGTTVTAAAFSVQMATIRSDQSQRDAQFDGRIMAVAAYPTGTFSLTKPISLVPVPAAGAVATYPATGNLTLHGQTRQVTFTVSAQRTATSIKVSGAIPVKFSDWSIPNPSFGSFVTTQSHGMLEFLLVFTKA